MALPPLTPAERTAALAKAAAARQARAAAKDRVKRAEGTLSQVLRDGEHDEAIAKMKVVSLLEAVPGIGKVRARQIMDELGIAVSRRIRGLGSKQVAALESYFDRH